MTLLFTITPSDGGRADRTVRAKGFNIADGYAHFFNENNQLVAMYNLAMLLSIVPDSGDLEVAWKAKQQNDKTTQNK